MSRKLGPDDFAPNRRAEPRLAVTRTIEILRCSASAAGSSPWRFMPAELTACSLHGVGLLLHEALDVGQQFLIKLKTPDRLRLLLYTVQNCAFRDTVRAGGPRYRIGARFSGFAAQEFDEDLQTVLDGLSGPA